jgi:pimeloyl-ACP methyl ester carboxylesterase
MAPVARELAKDWSILEPIQTATSLDGQVDELRSVLENQTQLPVILIGHSWGAWLSFILAARFPAFAQKLILVGSGPFNEEYVAGLQKTRINRLNQADKAEFNSIIQALGVPETEGKDFLLARLGELASITDSFDPIRDESNISDSVGPRGDIFGNVWQEAAEMRRNGNLLELGKMIRCPLTAIHGDYDPHPAEGVEKPLSAIIKDFRFILLKECGHTPWQERQAREIFYDFIRQELNSSVEEPHSIVST